MGLKTNVYIDAFNLYYGALRRTPYRWLDLAKLCQFMLPQNTIHQIKYFTALVKPRASNPSKPQRQQIYLRALKTIPNVSIVLGHYLSHEVMMPLANSPREKLQYIKVIKTEEKGSDVNLATHLLSDAYENVYDIAVVVSNDFGRYPRNFSQTRNLVNRVKCKKVLLKLASTSIAIMLRTFRRPFLRQDGIDKGIHEMIIEPL